MDVVTAQICVFGSIVAALGLFASYMASRENKTAHASSEHQQTLL